MNIIKMPDPEVDNLINTEERWLKYKDSFPFEPYNIQKSVVALIDYAIEKGIKNIILQAPVGTGKTVLCVAVADSVDSYYYLTPKIGLATQVENDFPKIKQVKGRGNFLCVYPGETDIKCDRARCTLDKKFKCSHKDRCPYYIQKEQAMTSPAVVSNPAYMNRVMLLPVGDGPSFEKRSITVWDEAHNLEDHFISMQENFISDGDYARLYRLNDVNPDDYKKLNMDIRNDDYDIIVSEIVGLYNYWKKTVQKKKLLIMIKNNPNFKELTELNRIMSIGERIEKILYLFNVPFKKVISEKYIPDERVNEQKDLPTEKVYDPSIFTVNNVCVSKEYGKKSNKFIFSPVTVRNSIEIIRNTSDINLFVSATILDFKVFCISLGIPMSAEETLGVVVDESPFDEERRLIYHTPCGYLNKNKLEENLPLLAEKIEAIISQNHAEHRGVILPYTHKIKEYLYEYLKDKFPGRIITHGRENEFIDKCPKCKSEINRDTIPDEKGRVECDRCGNKFFKYTRDSVIDRFMEEVDKPYILITTYMNEGFDLKGDIARFAIICKVPHPNIGDERIRKRLLFEQDSYREATGYSCDYKGSEESNMVEGKQIFYTNDVCSNWGCERCKGWYNMKTASHIVQMTGRVVRNKEDWAMIYVMDTGFKRFFSTHEYLFPSYFKNAVRWYK